MTINTTATSRLPRLLPGAIALILGVSAGPAFAQGTSAQREACAPDAIRLCQDSIPDVAATTACMKAHEAELSPACHRMFSAATDQPADTRRARRRIAREAAAPASAVAEPAAVEGFDIGQLSMPSIDTTDTPTSRAEDRRNARRVVTRLCKGNVLDAGTCRLTLGAIELSR